MRKTRRFLSMLAAFCLILTASVPALAAEDDYTYTVRIYSGKQGSIEGSDVKEYTGLHYGDRVSFYPQSQVSLNDDSKYYVRGLRESGKDNSESVAAASFTVTGDADYVVALSLIHIWYCNYCNRPCVWFRYEAHAQKEVKIKSL